MNTLHVWKSGSILMDFDETYLAAIGMAKRYLPINKYSIEYAIWENIILNIWIWCTHRKTRSATKHNMKSIFSRASPRQGLLKYPILMTQTIASALLAKQNSFDILNDIIMLWQF